MGAAAALAAAIAIEGRGLPFDPFDDHAQPAAPESPIAFSSLTEPQLHLPADRPEDNRRYLLWSTDGFPRIVNGRSSLDPIFTFGLIADMRTFPDANSVEILTELGVRTVALHTQRVRGSLGLRIAAGQVLQRHVLDERGGLKCMRRSPSVR